MYENKEEFRDKMGRMRTRSLFHECRFDQTKNDYEPIYTLADNDKRVGEKILHSTRQIYLELADVTEYEFANKCFYGWDHWQQVRATAWMTPYIKKWEDELKVKLKSQALKALVGDALSENKSAPTSAKYIAEEGWIKGGRGRPKKEDIDREAKTLARAKNNIQDDADRIGLILVSDNGKSQ